MWFLKRTFYVCLYTCVYHAFKKTCVNHTFTMRKTCGSWNVRLPYVYHTSRLRFCHRSEDRHGFEKIFQTVLCPTQLFQWKLICTFNQHCRSYRISIRLQFNHSLFSHKLLKMLLHWHTFFQNVPHVENTFKYTNTYTYVFCWPV